MQTTVSPRESQRVLPDGSRVRAFILKIRMSRSNPNCRQQLELHPCTREAAEVVLAHRIERHSLLDDNPCSG
jgi:hypothetical protein